MGNISFQTHLVIPSHKLKMSISNHSKNLVLIKLVIILQEDSKPFVNLT